MFKRIIPACIGVCKETSVTMFPEEEEIHKMSQPDISKDSVLQSLDHYNDRIELLRVIEENARVLKNWEYLRHSLDENRPRTPTTMEEYEEDSREYPITEEEIQLLNKFANGELTQEADIEDCVSDVEANSRGEKVYFSDDSSDCQGDQVLFYNPDELINKEYAQAKLRVEAPVYVPRYNPSTTFEMMVSLYSDGVTQQQLLEAGYPVYLVKKLSITVSRGNAAIRYAKREHQDVYETSGSRSVSNAKSHFSYQQGEMSKFWRINFSIDARLILKPQVYERASFHAWVHGVARKLYFDIKPENRKHCIITGNDACKVLYFSHGDLLPRVARDCLIGATVFVHDFSFKEKAPANVRFSDYVDLGALPKSLRVGERTIKSLVELVEIQHMFKRHMPLFRCANLYFQGDVIDVNTLQNNLDKVFIPHDKVVLQGRKCTPCSLFLRVKHTISLDLEATAQDVMKTIKEAFIEHSQYVVHVGSFLGALVTATTTANALFIVTSFLTANKSIISRCSDYIDLATSFLTGKVVLQGPMDSILSSISSNLNELWLIIVESSVLVFLKESAIGVLSLISPILRDLVSETKRAINRENSTTIARGIIEWIKDIIARIVESVKTKSMTPLWGRRWNVDVLIKEASTLEQYYPILTIQANVNPKAEKEIQTLVASKALSSFWVAPVPVSHYLHLVEKHLEQMNKTKSYLSSMSRDVDRLLRQSTSLQKHYDTIKLHHTGSSVRRVPWALYLFGKPGVGKTNIATMITKAISNLNGLVFDSSTCYYFQSGVNFQTGLDHTKLWIFMDDIDTSVAPEQAGIRNHVGEVIAIVNNAPYYIEEAAVEKKGSTFANPVGLVYCSNFKDGKAPTKTLECHAFYRRFSKHVTVSVKVEFQKCVAGIPNGQLDPVKAQESNTHDMYEFEVCNYYASEGLQTNQFLSAPVKMNLPQLMKCLSEDFSHHMQTQNLHMQRTAFASQSCKTCGLASDKLCGCTELLGSSVIDSLPTNLTESVYLQGAKVSSLKEYNDEHAHMSYYALFYVFKLHNECEDNSVCSVINMGLRFRNYCSFVSDSSKEEAKVLLNASDDGRAIDYCEQLDNLALRFKTVTGCPLFGPVYENSMVKDYQFANESMLYIWMCPKLLRERRQNWKLTDKVVEQSASYQCSLLLAGTAAMLISLKIASKLMEVVTQVIHPQGRMMCAADGNVPANWLRAEQVSKPGFETAPLSPSTFTKDDAIRAIKDSYLHVRCNNQTMHASCISSNVIVVPTHIGKFGDVLYFTQNAVTNSVTLSPENFKTIPSNTQMSLVKVNNLKGTLTIGPKLMLTMDMQISQFDECEIWSDRLVATSVNTGVKMSQGFRCLTSNYNSKDGDCGMVYLCRFNNSWKVAGMHYGVHESTNFSGTKTCTVSAMLYQQEIKNICLSFGATLEGVVGVPSTFSKIPDDMILGKFGPKSEIWAAQSHHDVKLHPFGTLIPPLPNSNAKTKIKFSIFSEDIRDLELSFCGVSPAFKLPLMRGDMINEKWVSPFTNMFKTQNFKEFDECYMQLAVYDYVNGLQDLLVEGYGNPSEYQALKGIPNSYVHAINMRTSAGPPFNVSKRAHYSITDDEVCFSPEIARQIDSINLLFDLLQIPRVSCVCAMKDEPLKITKDFPRIFNNLSSSHNVVLKQNCTPWKSLMRANPLFFECAVGINMTSSDSLRVLYHLQSIDPTLTNLYDGDATAMDKSWSGFLYEYVAYPIFSMTHAVGCDPHRARLSVLSLKHIAYSIKNDLFNVFNNPSGNDITVELNSICISLCERYVFYKDRHVSDELKLRVKNWFSTFFEQPLHADDPECVFRSYVALCTYGDDKVMAMKVPPSVNYCARWRDEIGIEVKDASKTSVDLLQKFGIWKPGMESRSVISFLQRQYQYLEGVPFPVAALSKKSIIRMLLFKKDSSLSEIDHAAAVCNDALRESVYHGREFHDMMLERILEIAEKYGFRSNPYLQVKLFEESIGLILTNNFQTWSTRDPPVLKDLETRLILQSKKMSKINLVKESNFDSTPNLHPQPNIVHNLGTVETASAVIAPPLVETTNFQTYPKTELNEFLTRPTLIAQTIFTNADVAGSFVYTVNPWSSFMADTVIAEKLSRFTYIRGTIQLIFKVTAPGLAYGSYSITALPQGHDVVNPSTAIASGLYFENILQTDHCALIDIANSNDVVFQLPFIADTDVLPLSLATNRTPAGLWDVYISCLVPVSTAVAAGVTSAYVKVYASLLDDYELVVPRFQGGKHKLVANNAMKQHAPKIYEAIKDGQGSSIANKVGDVLGMASILPVIGPLAGVASSVAHGVGTALSYFGFTRTSSETVPTSFVTRSVTNVAHVDGGDNGDTASLMYVNEISIDPTLSGFSSTDCLATGDIFSRWTLIKTGDWLTSYLSGRDLFNIPVTPSYCRVAAGALAMTTAGYVGLPFMYWRGDMEYKVVIPVSVAHRGALQVAWIPDGSIPAADVTNVAWNVIYDVSAGGVHNFTVGFARENPFLKNRIITDALSIIPYGDGNGVLLFRVVNPLMAQTVTANTMIYVFARAKSNMEFALPRDEVEYQSGSDLVSFPFQSRVILQGGALGDDDQTEAEQTAVLVMDSKPIPSDSLYFGERFGSVRELLQKPSKLNGISMGYVDPILVPIHLFPPGQNHDAYDFLTVWTWQGYYKCLFLGFACSERFKAIPDTPCWLGASRIDKTSISAYRDVIPTLAPMTYVGPNLGAEFNVPYYHPRKYVLSREFINPSDARSPNTLTVLSGYPGPDSGGVAVVNWYYSFGPDIRATCFRQVPKILFVDADVSFVKFF